MNTKRILAVLATIAIGGSAFSAKADTVTVKTEEELNIAIANVIEGRTIQLIDDITLTESVKISNKTPAFTLDLNGYVLRQTAENQRVITNESTLTIMDGNPTGSTHYLVKSGSDYVLYDDQPQTGVEGEDFFTVYGGCITGGNLADDGQSGSIGGGIYNFGTLYLTGGNICGNKSVCGSGVWHDKDNSCTISGNVKIKYNSESNLGLFIYENAYVSIGTPDSGMEVGITMYDKGQYHYEPCAGRFTVYGTAESNKNYFFSDDSGYEIKYNAGNGSGSYLETVEKTTVVCANIITSKEYATLDEAIAEVQKDETIQLIDDITLTESVKISSKTPAFTLDLNDHVLKQTAAEDRVIYNEGTLTIVDNAEEKTTKFFSYNDETFIWTLTEEDTEYSVTGGVITGGTTPDSKNAWGAGILNFGTLTINSGNICGNHTGVCGGGVCNIEKNSNTIVNGGTIAFNTAAFGGGLANNPANGKMTLKGGAITNNIAKSFSSEIPQQGGGLGCFEGNTVVGGTVVIYNNTCNGTASNIATLVSLQINSPQEGMNVGVTLLNSDMESVSGQLTTNGSETDAGYFFSDVDDYLVAYDSENEYLKLVAAPDACTIVETSTNFKSLSKAIADVKDGYTIRMLRDIRLNSAVTISDDTPAFILDLNNYVLSATSGNKAIINNGDLTIVDNAESKTTRYLTQDNETDLWSFTDSQTDYTVSGGCIYGCNITNVTDGGAIKNTGTLTLNSGNICGNSCIAGSESGHGGGVYNEGTFTMNGGDICYNVAGESGGGVADADDVLNNAFIMTGGNITNNLALYAGGGISSLNTLTISGGTVKNNKAGMIGGGIVMSNEGSTSNCSIKNCTITGNTAEYAGGVLGGGTCTLGGTTKITGNTKGNYAALNYDSFKGTTTIADDAAEGMSIGVTILCLEDGQEGFSTTVGKFTTNGSETDVKYFSSDSVGYVVAYNKKGYLELTSKEATCKIKETGTEYASIERAVENVEKDQTIQLLKDNKLNGELVIGSETPAFTLDLAGFVIKQTGFEERVIKNNGTLTIYDSKYGLENNRHYFVKNENIWSFTNAETEYYVDGGVITGGADPSGDGWGAGILNSGTLTINSGNICGNHTESRGGGVCNEGTGTTTVNGGTIAFNTADIGGGLSNANNLSNMILKGGRITNNIATYQGGGLGCDAGCIVGGTVVVDNNIYIKEEAATTSNLATWVPLQVSDPQSGMNIGITLTVKGGGADPGQFTEAVSDESVKNCFFSDISAYSVAYNSEGKYLELVSGTPSSSSCKIVETDTEYPTLEDAVSAVLYGQTIQMLKDTTSVTGEINITGKSFSLDLNGKEIKAAESKRVFFIDQNSGLTIKDSYTPGEDEEGGHINGSSTEDDGAIIYNNGTLNIEGGILQYGTTFADKEKVGGAIVNGYGSNFSMSGGIIRWCYAYKGGAIAIMSGNTSATISGGTIADNRVKVAGGAVFIEDEASLCVSGTAKIINNYVDNDNTEDDLSLYGTFSVTEPQNGMMIAVTKVDKDYKPIAGQFTSGEKDDYSQYFVSGREDYMVQYNSNGYLELVETPDACVNVDTKATFKSISSAIAAIGKSKSDNQTIKMLRDIDIWETIDINDTVPAFTLDLDGYVLKQTTEDENIIWIQEGASLTVKDSNTGKNTHYFTQDKDGTWSLTNEETEYSVSGGCITGGNVYDGKDGGAIDSYGTLTIASGNICGNSITSIKEGSNDGGAISSLGKFYMTGGEICYNYAQSSGGGIIFYQDNKESIISGGKIHHNTSNKGGGIAMEGGDSEHKNSILTISGGEFYDNVSTYDGKGQDVGGGGAVGGCGDLTVSGGDFHDNSGLLSGAIGIAYPGTLTMTGGKVYDNTGEYVAGIGSLMMGKLTILGGEISGNTIGVVSNGDYEMVLGGDVNISGNTGGNVILGKCETYKFENMITISDETPLTTKTQIGVIKTEFDMMSGSLSTDPIAGQITTNGTQDDAAFFKSDCDTLTLAYNAKGYLELVSGTPAAGFDLTITKAGYASLYYNKNLTVPANVTVYTYKYDETNNALVPSNVLSQGAIIPSGTGVIVKGDAGVYTFTETSSDPEKVSSVLVGVLEDTAVEKIEGTIYGYGQPADANYKPAFYMISSKVETIPAFKAYYIKAAEPQKAAAKTIMIQEN